MKNTIKNTLIAGGLTALAISACTLPEYTESKIYSCEKHEDKISAKKGNMIATKEPNYYGKIEVTYPNKMSLEQAVKALDACEKAFGLKAEKEEQ